MTFQIENITLYKSGIGFFNGICKEHDFILPVNDDVVDDVLKSLAIEGLKSVTFSAAETKETIQQKIGININSTASFLSLGQHLIGLEVEIDSEERVTGTVVGVDFISVESSERNDKGIDVLIIKKDEQIIHIPISEIKQLKILNETIKKDLEVFLNLQASTRKTGVTNLKIITEKDNAKIQWVSPISAWRLSYRVQFDEEKNKVNFTGIALVDNTTSIDWEKVKLRLVTGQPVSFKYNLHTPFYVSRPWVQRDEDATSPLLGQPVIEITKRKPSLAAAIKPTISYSEIKQYDTGQVLHMKDEADWDIAREVIAMRPQVKTEELTTTTAYQIVKPININRSESSLIPLFSQSYSAEQYIVLREDRIEEAMDALVFHKPLELDKGVGTIYINDVYAGESMVIRGSDFLAYRLNQEIKMIKDVTTSHRITSITILKNIMQQKFTSTMSYNFKVLNNSDKKKLAILEIPKISNYSPTVKADKESANYYRYKFELEPGTIEKTIIFEHHYMESIYIKNLSEESILALTKEGTIDERDKRIILNILSNLKELKEKEKSLENLDKEIRFSFKNQERIRENIKTLQKIGENNERDVYILLLKSSEQKIAALEKEKNQLLKQIEKLKEKI